MTEQGSTWVDRRWPAWAGIAAARRVGVVPASCTFSPAVLNQLGTDNQVARWPHLTNLAAGASRKTGHAFDDFLAPSLLVGGQLFRRGFSPVRPPAGRCRSRRRFHATARTAIPIRTGRQQPPRGVRGGAAACISASRPHLLDILTDAAPLYPLRRPNAGWYASPVPRVCQETR